MSGTSRCNYCRSERLAVDLWAAALLTPRPPELMELNEPRTSLHPPSEDEFAALNPSTRTLIVVNAKAGHSAERLTPRDAVPASRYSQCMVATSGSPAQSDQVRVAFRSFLLDIALNAIVPFVLYRLSKRYVSPSEFTALIIATTFPIGKSIFAVARRRHIDPVAVIVLLGIGASSLALLMGGSPRLLLMRESLFTALFGLACLGSLLLRRPMMFYFGRHFMAGADATRRRRYEASWALPEVRFTSRLITIVWGCVYLGEFAARVAVIFLVPVAWVLVISPVLLGSLTLATIAWTFHYAKRARERALPKLDELMHRETP